MLRSTFVLMLSLALTFGSLVPSAIAKGPKITDPNQGGDDFALQGEYSGEVEIDGDRVKAGVQVVALGGGEFKFVGYPLGLPGDGWDPSMEAVQATSTGTTLEFEHLEIKGELTPGKLTLLRNGETVGVLNKVERKSPTLGAKPPEGATVLFDGSSPEQWNNGRLDGDLLMQGTTSKSRFGNHRVHIEFRLPFQPQDRGQARGNSGIYLQGRYEVQMLDSFGLEGEQNECGGIYSIKAPDLNMCFPPLAWQTYDIDFSAAVFEDGELKQPARMTVKHNGVVIHKDVELPKSTTAAPMKVGPEDGPIYLQDHGSPVRYRNIWVVEQ